MQHYVTRSLLSTGTNLRKNKCRNLLKRNRTTPLLHFRSPSLDSAYVCYLLQEAPFYNAFIGTRRPHTIRKR